MDGLECFDLHPFSMAVKVLDNIFHNLYEIITETIIVPYDRTSRREVSIYHAGDIPPFPIHPHSFFPSNIQKWRTVSPFKYILIPDVEGGCDILTPHPWPSRVLLYIYYNFHVNIYEKY